MEKQEKLLVDLSIRFKDGDSIVSLNKTAIPFNEAFVLVTALAERYPDNQDLQSWWRGGNIESFGVCSMSRGEDCKFSVSAYMPREIGDKEFTCPRSQEMFTNSWQAEQGKKATWDKIGEDRVCSYCGSLHPEDFEKILNIVIDTQGQGAEVEVSSKNYKIYAKRKGVRNASEGGIKFYTPHAFADPATEEWRNKTQEVLNTALIVSRRVFEDSIRLRRDALEKAVDDINNKE